jgi:hypothetical protein
MKNIFYALAVALFVAASVPAMAGETTSNPSGCANPATTICTIEIWLAHSHKKEDKELRNVLKDNSIKVLRNTIQVWRPRGGHPPTNVAIGSGISARDAQLVITLAEKYNDKVDMLIVQSLNPPHYAAIATSAWDEKSQVPISEEELAALKDPKLSDEEFHTLYRKLTKEATRVQAFY